MAKKTKLLDPIHPGEILTEEFMKPLGISINRLSRDLHVPPNRIHSIVHGNRAITADTALRLGTYFGVTPGDLAESANGVRFARGPQDSRRRDRQDGPQTRSRVRVVSQLCPLVAQIYEHQCAGRRRIEGCEDGIRIGQYRCFLVRTDDN